MISIELNPIIARELRTRWRGRNAFVLVFVFAALLAIVIGWTYGNIAQNLGKEVSIYKMAAQGRGLFTVATVLQSFAWMLLAPTLTATAIASERERGLLDGLMLSPLTAWQIVVGKLFSSLTLSLLIIGVALPIGATAFLLGGVSPGEFLLAFLLHLVAALTGASLGLACSAWSRRANIALRMAIVFVFCWMMVTAVGMSFGAFRGPAAFIGFSSLSLPWMVLGYLLWFSNPAVVALFVLNERSADIASMTLGVDIPVWIISVAVQLCLSLLFLWLATRALYRPFAEQYWIERSATQASPNGGKARKEGTSRMWWVLPIVGYLNFENPVLQREVRGKFRMRQAPLWVLLFEGVLGLGVLYFYVRTLWGAWFEPSQRETIWWVLSFIVQFVIILATAVMGASAFTREREGSTWEGLNLSLLRPAEVIRGKLLAPMLSCLVYSLPLWPLMLPCIRSIVHPGLGVNWGVSLTQAAGTFAIITATAFCYTAFGMFCSWRARSTSTAVGLTLGAIFVVLTILPIFTSIMSIHFPRFYELLYFYHPMAGLGSIVSRTKSITLVALVSSGGLFAIGLVFLLLLHRQMRAQIRERDERCNVA